MEEAGSAIITSQELQATDPDTDDLKIFFMVNAFPMRGELLVNGSVVNNFSQSDVINNLVVYRHGVEEIGVKEVHDFFNLTLSDDLQRQPMGETPRIGTVKPYTSYKLPPFYMQKKLSKEIFVMIGDATQFNFFPMDYPRAQQCKNISVVVVLVW